MPMHPKEHGSPGRAIGTVGQTSREESFWFSQFSVGCEGLFTSIQAVLSTVRPVFPAGGALLPCPAASACQALQLCSGSLTPAAAALPGQGPLLLARGWCPWGCAGTLCPFTQKFSKAALFIGGYAERRKMRISCSIGLVVAC